MSRRRGYVADPNQGRGIRSWTPDDDRRRAGRARSDYRRLGLELQQEGHTPAADALEGILRDLDIIRGRAMRWSRMILEGGGSSGISSRMGPKARDAAEGIPPEHLRVLALLDVAGRLPDILADWEGV